jgi:hypothetical protein
MLLSYKMNKKTLQISACLIAILLVCACAHKAENSEKSLEEVSVGSGGAASPSSPKTPGSSEETDAKNAPLQRYEDVNRLGLQALGDLKPLFSEPKKVPLRRVLSFVGRDLDSTGQDDTSIESAKKRFARIQELEAVPRSPTVSVVQSPKRKKAPVPKKAKKAPVVQIEPLPQEIELLQLLQEQAAFFENLLGYGIEQQAFQLPEIELKSVYLKIDKLLVRLLNVYPKAPQIRDWQGESHLAKLKLGQSSAVLAAQRFTSRNKALGISNRVRMVGAAVDTLKFGNRASFGSFDTLLKLPMDNASHASLALFAGESALAKKQDPRARRLFFEAISSGKNVKIQEGKENPIVLFAVARLLKLELAAKSQEVDPRFVELLNSAGQQDAARHYLEKKSLALVRTNPKKAVANYVTSKNISELQSPMGFKVDARCIDIAINSKNPTLIKEVWIDLLGAFATSNPPGFESRAYASQKIFKNILSKQKRLQTSLVTDHVQLHDSYRKQFKGYAQDDDAEIDVIRLLSKAEQDGELIARADAFVALPHTSKATKAQALLLSARSRERLLGISPEPRWVHVSGWTVPAAQSEAYLKNLDALIANTDVYAAEIPLYQSAYISDLKGDNAQALVRIDKALLQYSQSKHAPKALSYFLDDAQEKRDEPRLEKLARLAEAQSIVPFRKHHKNVRKILEDSIFAQAKIHSDAKQHSAAAGRYFAFQRDFTTSPRAPEAIWLAAWSMEQDKKDKESLEQLEFLLQNYAGSKQALEARWKAAELALKLGDKPKAAAHFEKFAQTYVKESLERKAYVRAAQVHESAENLAGAVAAYDAATQQSSTPKEKIRSFKEMARLQRSLGKSDELLNTFDRLAQFAKPLKPHEREDDYLWALLQKLDLWVMEQQKFGDARFLAGEVKAQVPVTQLGFRLLAQSKFLMGKVDAEEIRLAAKASDIVVAHEELMKKYAVASSQLLGACEAPDSEWCAAGYYELATLAREVYLSFTQPQAGSDERILAASRNATQTSGEKLRSDAEVYAREAKQKAASGQAVAKPYDEKIKTLPTTELKMASPALEASPTPTSTPSVAPTAMPTAVPEATPPSTPTPEPSPVPEPSVEPAPPAAPVDTKPAEDETPGELQP